MGIFNLLFILSESVIKHKVVPNLVKLAIMYMLKHIETFKYFKIEVRILLYLYM